MSFLQFALTFIGASAVIVAISSALGGGIGLIFGVLAFVALVNFMGE